jgi:hypothetical protein
MIEVNKRKAVFSNKASAKHSRRSRVTAATQVTMTTWRSHSGVMARAMISALIARMVEISLV